MIVKIPYRILFTLLISITFGVITSSATEIDPTNDSKSQSELQQTGDKENKNQESEKDAISGLEGDGMQFVKDSTEDDSVNKYNFIFHFLYKFKYDQEESL